VEDTVKKEPIKTELNKQEPIVVKTVVQEKVRQEEPN